MSSIYSQPIPTSPLAWLLGDRALRARTGSGYGDLVRQLGPAGAERVVLAEHGDLAHVLLGVLGVTLCSCRCGKPGARVFGGRCWAEEHFARWPVNVAGVGLAYVVTLAEMFVGLEAEDGRPLNPSALRWTRCWA